ncbi:hypothetical protein BZG36_05414 [Bifiguratus adelaidae]|uniref:Uncharacterized protein n=1 Tax=Bifiguratus adelaidae TaxID=1938954 RepID=A0A261XTF2_9FUNG|nr:hypothetical protein BZG36_05414 [Bifiguratus adelaidae]
MANADTDTIELNLPITHLFQEDIARLDALGDVDPYVYQLPTTDKANTLPVTTSSGRGRANATSIGTRTSPSSNTSSIPSLSRSRASSASSNASLKPSLPITGPSSRLPKESPRDKATRFLGYTSQAHPAPCPTCGRY